MAKGAAMAQQANSSSQTNQAGQTDPESQTDQDSFPIGSDSWNMPDPELLRIEQVSDGWIKKYQLTYKLPNGREFPYESVSRKSLQEYEAELRGLSENPAHANPADAVCIVPRTQNNRLVLIKEFRYPLNSWCIAFPAGLIDPGEDIETTCERELAEETGYSLHRDEQGKTHVKALSLPGYSSAGMSEESVQVVYVHVDNEPSCEQQTESVEYIQVFTIAMEDVPRFLETNTTPIGTRAQLILESFSNNTKRYGTSH